MHVLSLLCGCLIPIIFAAIVFVSEFFKFWLSWDMRYVGMPWVKIWRAERLYKRGDFRAYHVLLYGESAVAHQEEIDRRKYGRRTNDRTEETE